MNVWVSGKGKGLGVQSIQPPVWRRGNSTEAWLGQAELARKGFLLHCPLTGLCHSALCSSPPRTRLCPLLGWAGPPRWAGLQHTNLPRPPPRLALFPTAAPVLGLGP